MEGVGSVVESCWKMAGKSYRRNSQHQTDEREHSIHDVGGTETVLSTMTN